MNIAVVVVSGGLDSIVLLHHVVKEVHPEKVITVSFNYGQKHNKELLMARHHSTLLDTTHIELDISFMKEYLKSALTTENIEVPDGHYTQDNMISTIVPNRNSIMLNIAAGIAISQGANGLYTGVHSGDHHIYPDCRPAFLCALDNLLNVANEGICADDFQVVAPFMDMPKSDIVSWGARLKVDFQNTWSCYKGGELHCSECGTCVERRIAFIAAEVEDPTEYLFDITSIEFLRHAIKDLRDLALWDKSAVVLNSLSTFATYYNLI